MRFSSVLSSLLRGKFLAIALVSIAVATGTVAMAASIPAGRHVVQAVVSLASATSTPDKPSVTQRPGSGDTATPGTNKSAANCAGLPEAQTLAASFSLSTDSTSDALQVMCALHQGTFKGTTPSGAAISSSWVYGYGEIKKLLTYARYLATHDTSSAGGTLTSENTRSYLAEALHNCGTTALEACLMTKIPGFQPGQSDNNGKPSSTPTPGSGRPTSTPTPPVGGKPTSTPTPPSH
jgi:hypothetical protein